MYSTRGGPFCGPYIDTRVDELGGAGYGGTGVGVE